MQLKKLEESPNPVGLYLDLKSRGLFGFGESREKSTELNSGLKTRDFSRALKAKDYKKCVLYTTLSPCDMCSGAILLYKIPVVVIGENKTFKGPENHLAKRGVKLINLNLEECKKMMKDFILKKPEVWLEDIGE
jgi:cytosine/creatinine deaminase